MATTVSGVGQILYLLDQAFYGSKWHSLLGNLQAVTPDDWLWIPPNGRRSIRDIMQHIAGGKLMYENHAFGDAKLTWYDPVVAGDDRLFNIEAAIDWLQECQARLRQRIACLDDEELLRPRLTNWGKLAETRWIIAVIIEHDLYHAGEINHIRCLHQQDDE